LRNAHAGLSTLGRGEDDFGPAGRISHQQAAIGQGGVRTAQQ